jgi:hypothetical protein
MSSLNAVREAKICEKINLREEILEINVNNKNPIKYVGHLYTYIGLIQNNNSIHELY